MVLSITLYNDLIYIEPRYDLLSELKDGAMSATSKEELVKEFDTQFDRWQRDFDQYLKPLIRAGLGPSLPVAPEAVHPWTETVDEPGVCQCSGSMSMLSSAYRLRLRARARCAVFETQAFCQVRSVGKKVKDRVQGQKERPNFAAQDACVRPPHSLAFVILLCCTAG